MVETQMSQSYLIGFPVWDNDKFRSYRRKLLSLAYFVNIRTSPLVQGWYDWRGKWASPPQGKKGYFHGRLWRENPYTFATDLKRKNLLFQMDNV